MFGSRDDDSVAIGPFCYLLTKENNVWSHIIGTVPTDVGLIYIYIMRYFRFDWLLWLNL